MKSYLIEKEAVSTQNASLDSSSIVRTARIDTALGFSALEPFWDNLLQKSDNNEVFLTWDWIKTWWDTFGADKKLFIVASYDAKDNLVALAPLMIRKRKMAGLTIRSLEFIGSGEEIVPDHLGFISFSGLKTDFILKIVEYLAVNSSLWDMVRLTDMRQDSALFEELKRSMKNKLRLGIFQNGVCPYIKLNSSWEEYSKKLSRKVRYNTKRNERLFREERNGGFSISIDEPSLGNILDRLRQIHEERMTTKGTRAFSVTHLFWRFHKDIALKLFKKNRLSLGILRSGDKIVACQYSFQYNQKVYFYQVGQDNAYAKYSTGSILIMNMIKSAIEKGLVEYDFLRGDEPYKLHWANDFRNNYEVFAWNDSAKSKFLFYLMSAKRLLKRAFMSKNTSKQIC